MKIQAYTNSMLNTSVPQTRQTQIIASKKSASNVLANSTASMTSKSYSTAQVNHSNKIAFHGYYEKLIEKILDARNIKKIHLTFKEAVKLLELVGYTIRQRDGSHAFANKPGASSLVIVRPHGGEQYISLKTMDNLKAVIAEYKSAQNS